MADPSPTDVLCVLRGLRAVRHLPDGHPARLAAILVKEQLVQRIENRHG